MFHGSPIVAFICLSFFCFLFEDMLIRRKGGKACDKKLGLLTTFFITENKRVEKREKADTIDSENIENMNLNWKEPLNNVIKFYMKK